jgi:Alkyl hydroperoxide reductase, large subunit
MTIILEK